MVTVNDRKLEGWLAEDTFGITKRTRVKKTEFFVINDIKTGSTLVDGSDKINGYLGLGAQHKSDETSYVSELYEQGTIKKPTFSLLITWGASHMTFGLFNNDYIAKNATILSQKTTVIKGKEQLWALDVTNMSLHDDIAMGNAIIDLSTKLIELDSDAYGKFKNAVKTANSTFDCNKTSQCSTSKYSCEELN